MVNNYKFYRWQNKLSVLWGLAYFERLTKGLKPPYAVTIIKANIMTPTIGN